MNFIDNRKLEIERLLIKTNHRVLFKIIKANTLYF